jgi:SNF family Na+-dependent transporter
MRTRRLKWLASAGLGLLLLGYAVGRRHQHDTVEAYRELAGALEQMVTRYEAANAAMWESLGVMARPVDR